MVWAIAGSTISSTEPLFRVVKLRSQMLLAGALTLIVPVVGWQSVKQLYSALQQTRIDDQTLKVANMRLALSEAPELSVILGQATAEARAHDLYAERSRYPLFLDGYADDWKTLHGGEISMAEKLATSDDSVRVRAATRDKYLFLHIQVDDERVVYHEIPVFRADAGEGELPDRRTQLVNGDAVELLIESQTMQLGETMLQHGLFRAMAPGPLTALQASDGPRLSDSAARQRAGMPIQPWQAYWQNAIGGFQLEIQLPLPASGSAIAISVIDVDQRNKDADLWTGSASPTQMASWHQAGSVGDPPGRIYHNSEQLESRLKSWTSPGVRARLFDQQGRLVADVNELYTQSDLDEESADEAAFTSDGVLNALLFRLFSFFVAGDLPLLPETRSTPVSLTLSKQRRAAITADTPMTSRYVTEENDRVLGTLAPIGSDPRRAYLLLEANEEHNTAYAGSQLARLFSLLLLVSLLAGSGLLIFALLLSSRIRRLSQQAQQAVSVDGRVHGLPGSDARDEIGDLSRKLSSLLSRSAAYNHYLEALSSRLSHELRTPLSVVRTSIENIEKGNLDEESRVLIERASAGADHLGMIIKALVDSTRLEQIVLDADNQRINLGDWLRNCSRMYAQVYPTVSIVTSPRELPDVYVHASPELLKQALDKLVDNAVDFNEGPGIVLQLSVDADHPGSSIRLAVANKGQPIDESRSDDFFSPLISLRDRGQADNGHHLGLGLYIVRMVAESCNGAVFARNEDGWVVFGMALPALNS